MSRRLAIVVAVGAALISASSLTAAVLGQPDDPVTGPAAAPIPTLSDTEKADAAKIALDSTATLPGVGRVSVRDVGVWHTHDLRKLGAIVVLDAQPDGPVKAVWPTINYDRSEKAPRPYADDSFAGTARNFDQLLVLVDMERRQAVQITPEGMSVEVSDDNGNAERRTTPLGD